MSNRYKLNSLYNNWPDCKIVTYQYLNKFAISKQLIASYLKSGWLMKIANGLYSRPNEKLDWPNYVNLLQTQLGRKMHLGGMSAIDLVGRSHYIRLKLEITLFAKHGIRMPLWAKRIDFNQAKLCLINSNLFEDDIGLEFFESIWLRNDLNNFKKRLTALETRSAQDGILLTESQLAALEKKKDKLEALGEIMTEHPGYLIAQDTYYVGTIKGVGRIYQQTVIDTYSRVAEAKLYQEKTPITSADVLNDRVIPFFASHKVDILRVLTDRGTEYCGTLENHAYQLYLSVEGIEHTKTKANSPQTNGICERFHKTMKQEFYDTAFRKKIYVSIDDLQRDVDAWLISYNNNRAHSGKYCYGKTPMQTYLDSKHIALEKSNESLYNKEISDSQNLNDIQIT